MMTWLLWAWLWTYPNTCFEFALATSGCSRHHLPVSPCEVALLYVCRHPDHAVAAETLNQIKNGP